MATVIADTVFASECLPASAVVSSIGFGMRLEILCLSPEAILLAGSGLGLTSRGCILVAGSRLRLNGGGRVVVAGSRLGLNWKGRIPIRQVDC